MGIGGKPGGGGTTAGVGRLTAGSVWGIGAAAVGGCWAGWAGRVACGWCPADVDVVAFGVAGVVVLGVLFGACESV